MILFYLLVTVMPMVRHPLWSDFLGELTVIKYLGIACLIYAAFSLRFRATPLRLFATWQVRFFVPFAILVMALFVTLGDPLLPVEISPFMSFASFLAFLFVTLTLVDSVERLRWVLLMAVGSVAYASLHVLREWQKYGGMAAGYRPGWVTGDPNYYSISALLCIPIAIYLLRTRQAPWERYFCVGSVLVTVLALTLAASRGAFVGIAVAVVVMAFHSRHRLKLLAGALVVTIPLMLVAPSSPLSRILNPDRHDIYSAQHRADLVWAGLAMFESRLLTGIGPGNFKPLLGRFADLDEHHIAHNTYIEVMAETGIPGILLFLSTIAATYVSLERIRRARPGDDLLGRTAEALEVALAGFLSAGLFISAENHRLFWLIVFLSAALVPLSAATPAPAPPAPSPADGPATATPATRMAR